MNLTTLLILLALKVSVFLAVFALGLDASRQETLYLFRNPGQLVRSLLPMYIIMPLVAGGIVAVFDIHPAVKIALVALAVSPIPPLLPKKQLKAGGEESYTIGLLVAMSLFAVVFIPIAIELFERAFKTPAQMTPIAVAQLVLVTVLVPLAIGIAVRYALPELAERMVKPISLVATVLLLVSVIPILFVAWPAIASLIGNGTLAIIAAFTLVGLAAGHVFGGPNPEDRTVLALSTASRHPGVAIAITSTNFPEQKLALAAILLYLLVSMLVTISYLNWRKREERGRNLKQLRY